MQFKPIWKLKCSMVTTLFVMILLLVSLTSATYAWFSFGADTNIEPLSSTVSKGDISLLIANKIDGNYQVSVPMILDQEVDYLEPVSTSDLKKFYTSVGQDPYDVSIFFREVKEPYKKMFHGTVYLTCRYGDGDVYFYLNGLNFGKEAQVVAALRLGLHITTADGKETTRIFDLTDLAEGPLSSSLTVPESGTVVSDVDSEQKAIFVKDGAVNISEYMSKGQTGDIENGQKKLCTIKKDEIATIEYWLYLEGCDEHCHDTVKGLDFEFQLAFAGIKVPQER